MLQISRRAAQNRPVRAIRAISRLTIGALNQQGQRVIGTLEMSDLSLVRLDRIKLDNLPLTTVSFCGKIGWEKFSA